VDFNVLINRRSRYRGCQLPFLGCIRFTCCRVVFRSLYCRLATIEPPLRRHQEKVTIWCIVIWPYSCIYMAYLTVLRELNHPIVIINILSGTHTILPSFISVIFYIRIYFALRNNRKRACVLDDSGQIVANAYRRERNMTKAMMAVLGLFLLCITPWFLLYQVIGACPTCSEHTSVEIYPFAIFDYIFLLNSLLNPFLYAWRLPKFRSAFKIMVKTSRILRTDRIGTMTN